MKNERVIFFAGIFYSCGSLFAATPSTNITSERMEMLRFHDHNEFLFVGKVKIQSKSFSGSCDRMWVRTQSDEQTQADYRGWLWCYGQVREEKPLRLICWVRPFGCESDKKGPVKQLRLIVACGNVFLETKDATTGEIKQAHSQRAVIFPKEEKMVLTQQAVVKCSVQGTFRGEKITFYKGSEQVIVENGGQGQRSEVLL